MEKPVNLYGSNSPRRCLEKINIYANEPSAKFARFRSISRPLCGRVVYSSALEAIPALTHQTLLKINLTFKLFHLI
jgi:hypothetical protein